MKFTCMEEIQNQIFSMCIPQFLWFRFSYFLMRFSLREIQTAVQFSSQCTDAKAEAGGHIIIVLHRQSCSDCTFPGVFLFFPNLSKKALHAVSCNKCWALSQHMQGRELLSLQRTVFLILFKNPLLEKQLFCFFREKSSGIMRWWKYHLEARLNVNCP